MREGLAEEEQRSRRKKMKERRISAHLFSLDKKKKKKKIGARAVFIYTAPSCKRFSSAERRIHY